MSANISTYNLGDFTNLEEIIWIDTVEGLAREAYNSGMFKTMSVPANTGEIKRFDEIDLEEYADDQAEGDQGNQAKYQQGYYKDVTVKTVSKYTSITRQMRQYNKYPEVIARLTNMSQLPFNRMELDLSHRVTFATATSYVDKNGNTVDTTTGDGLSWASTAHLLRATTATYRNRLANNPKISKGALQAMRRMAQENALNQFGEKVACTFDILWTTDDAEQTDIAMEYLESVGAPDFNNPGVKNVMQGKYRLVILPRVATDANGRPDTTKRYYWGLASTMHIQAYLGVWVEPTVVPFYVVPDTTETYVTGAYADYGIGIVSGRGFCLSTGDGTP